MARQRTRNSTHALLMALACGATVETAARQLGISDRTVYRRLDDPAFKDELRKLRSGMVTRASAMLTAAAMESVKTLLELQKSSNGGAVRLGAARAVLEIGVKLREIGELEERLAALEEQLASAGPERYQ